jgi:histidinol phosphatase-like PHP family hydrolase
MKIDLHVHIKRLSRCAKMDIPDLVPKLLSHNIHGVCPLDHHYWTTNTDINEIQKLSKDITVFKGTEINIRGPQGCIEDFILISSKDPLFLLKQFTLWELLDFIQKSDALIFLAHPFRHRDFVDFNWSWFTPDAVEIYSTHTNIEHREKIKDLANKHGLRPIVTSDAHKDKHIGPYYTEIPDGVKTCEELKWIIKTGRYHLPI